MRFSEERRDYDDKDKLKCCLGGAGCLHTHCTGCIAYLYSVAGNTSVRPALCHLLMARDV